MCKTLDESINEYVNKHRGKYECELVKEYVKEYLKEYLKKIICELVHEGRIPEEAGAEKLGVSVIEFVDIMKQFDYTFPE